MAAINECLTILGAALEGAGLAVVIDRQSEDKITGAEGEVVALNFLGADCQMPLSCNSYLWTAQVSIEPWADVTASQSPLERVTALAALISPVFAADPTFGGKFHDTRFAAVSSGLDEMTGDRGTMSLTVTLQYWTTRADITVISSD